MSDIKLGKYEHFKGKQYEVVGFAKNTETFERFVLYRPLYEPNDLEEDTVWARPMNMFVERVYFEGESVPRFKYLGK